MSAPPPPSQPGPRAGAVRGGPIVGAGLISGLIGLAIARFLVGLVARSPLRVSAYTLFWGTVLLGVAGLLAGMAVEAVRQLQAANPDPEYHRGRERSLRNRR